MTSVEPIDEQAAMSPWMLYIPTTYVSMCPSFVNFVFGLFTRQTWN